MVRQLMTVLARLAKLLTASPLVVSTMQLRLVRFLVLIRQTRNDAFENRTRTQVASGIYLADSAVAKQALRFSNVFSVSYSCSFESAISPTQYTRILSTTAQTSKPTKQCRPFSLLKIKHHRLLICNSSFFSAFF